MISLTQAALLACVGLFYTCVMLLLRLRDLKNQAVKREVQYVDTIGIEENPPRNFIETWSGRTINFKLDRYIVSIPMLSSLEGTKYICIIAGCFSGIKSLHEYIKQQVAINAENKNVKQKLQWIVQEKILQIRLMQMVRRIAKTLYSLSVKHVNRRNGYRKAIIAKCNNDFIWMLDVMEQINDYWQLVKKKLTYLAEGKTLRQTVGYSFSWRDLKLGSDGKVLVTPRYG